MEDAQPMMAYEITYEDDGETMRVQEYINKANYLDTIYLNNNYKAKTRPDLCIDIFEGNVLKYSLWMRSECNWWFLDFHPEQFGDDWIPGNPGVVGAWKAIDYPNEEAMLQNIKDALWTCAWIDIDDLMDEMLGMHIVGKMGAKTIL